MPGDKPKDKPRRSYWDSCVFLALINREPGRSTVVNELMEHARKGDLEVVTSLLTITEVAYAVAEKHSPSTATLAGIDKLWDHASPVKLVEFHRLIAVDARDLMRQGLPKGLSLKPPDAIHLSTASRNGCAEILTYDPKWTAYAGLVGVPVSEPAIAQGVLDYEGDAGTS